MSNEEKVVGANYEYATSYAESLFRAFPVMGWGVHEYISIAHDKLLEAARKGVSESGMGTFLKKSIYHAVVDGMRRRKMEEYLPEDFDRADEDDAIRAADLRDELKKLERMLGEDYEIFRLVAVGYTFGEIAEIIGTEVGTVSSRIFRKRKEMREKYAA
jgi:RNA polymerase sigma factor (sigma-70 family)